jgi:hypothetical protein
MNPMIIDKENALLSVQEIITLVSNWKILKVTIEDETFKYEKIKKNYEQALKDYEEWNFITGWIIND